MKQRILFDEKCVIILYGRQAYPLILEVTSLYARHFFLKLQKFTLNFLQGKRFLGN